MKRSHEHGYWEDTEGNSGGTLCCCHCNSHFQVVPGSGKRRGFCTRCHDVTCGSEACMACVPFSKVQDDLEAGKMVEGGIFHGMVQKPVQLDPKDADRAILFNAAGQKVA